MMEGQIKEACPLCGGKLEHILFGIPVLNTSPPMEPCKCANCGAECYLLGPEYAPVINGVRLESPVVVFGRNDAEGEG